VTASLAEQVESLLVPAAERNGYELVAVETAGGDKQPIVRVFLDREGGIDIDAICQANAWVSRELERLEALSGPYTLEVSSPGVDRPLRTLADFERFAGHTAKLKTVPLDGRRAFTGRIEAVDGDAVVVDVDGTPVHIPVEAIKKARLKVDVDFGS
jgi:ribosome maturation factor RimP